MMPFVRKPGVTGKVWVPEPSSSLPKRYPCPDCFVCQQCSEERCSLCRSQRVGSGAGKLSRGESDRCSQCEGSNGSTSSDG